MNFLVTAIGSMSAEAVIGAIRAASAGAVVGCDTNPRGWLATASLVDAFVQVPMARDAAGYLEALDVICTNHRIDLIIPLTDPEVDVLAANWREDAGRGAVAAISAPRSVARCRDKWLLHETLRSHPIGRIIPTVLLGAADRGVIGFPAIAKPRRGRSSEGVVRVTCNAQLDYLRHGDLYSDYVLQPFIQGDVYTVDVVRQPERREVAAVARRELIRSVNGAGLTVEVAPNPPLEAAAKDLAIALDLRGCVNLEFIRHGDEYLLMDVNPRFSAGVAFTQAAGYEPVVNHLRCFLGTAIELPADIPTLILSKRHREFRC